MAAILLAEDDDMVREAIALLLRNAGHEVREASHGGEALTAIEANAPDLVVTDVFMPSVDGIELVRQIRATKPDVKVLAISGGGMYQDPKLATQLVAATGAHSVLHKPVRNAELLEEIAHLVGA